MALPVIVAIVGSIRAPQRARVIEIGSDRGIVSAGVLDKGGNAEKKNENININLL